MLMQEERELVVEYGKKMSADRLSTGTSGNISIYNAEKGLMAISPSGLISVVMYTTGSYSETDASSAGAGVSCRVSSRTDSAGSCSGSVSAVSV